MVRSSAAIPMHTHPSVPVAPLAFVLLTLSCLGCQKASEAIVSIALHQTSVNILYVTTNDAVYKSRDAGASWERFPSFSVRRVTTVAIDPQLPATIYAGTMGDAIYKSPDGGQHWLPHNVGLKEHVSFVNQFVFHPALNEKIYAATTVGVYYTNQGLNTLNIRALEMAPQNPQVLYARTNGSGLYYSRNGGDSWTPLPLKATASPPR